jgi:SAM-dependent methyltransferase
MADSMEENIDYIHNYIDQTDAQKELSSCRYQFAQSVIERDLVEEESLIWLDVGSNIGIGLPDDDSNITLLSSDIDKRYLDLQNNNLAKINFNATKIPFGNECFDVISCFETIEHIELKDVYKLLPEISRVLKEYGLFFISTPNKDVNGKRKMSDDHKQEFNKTELISILDKFGFEVIESLGQNFVKKDNILHQSFLNLRQNLLVSSIYDNLPSSLIKFVRNETINAFGDGEVRKVQQKEAERIIYFICQKKF